MKVTGIRIKLKKTIANIKRSKYILILVFGLCYSINLKAQPFKHMVILPETQEKGIHKIIISPNIIAQSASNYNDLRLFDNQGKEVPYILPNDLWLKQHKTFVPYQLISKSTPGDTATEIVLKKLSKNSINNLSLFLYNVEKTKQIIISGSYNQKQWFAVKQSYNINGIANQNKIVELNKIYFPLSDYTYYKVLVNDKNSLPVKVVKAGYYTDTLTYSAETLIHVQKTIRTENNIEHISTIQLNFDSEYAISKIKLNLNAPNLYQRPISIYALRESNFKVYKEHIQETTLQSSSDNQITLDNVRAKQLLLEIKNENNPLLEVSKIECFQLSNFIMAYLENKGKYVLKYGNDSLSAPAYDLTYFENSIPALTPVIETVGLTIIDHPEKPVKETIRPFYYNKKFLTWTAIVAVVLVLLMIFSKMLNEMKKKSK